MQLPPGFVVDTPAPRMIPGVQPAKTSTPQTTEERERTIATTARTNQEIGAYPQQQARQQREFVQGLRKEYQALQPVKDYGTILPIHISALQAGDNGAGDLNIIYGLAKILDPGSVVREGELQLAQNTGSLGESLKGYYKQVTKGGRLTPNIRAGLLNEMDTRGRVVNQQYNQTRDFYRGLANQYGISPGDIIGPHVAAPYQDFAKKFRADQAAKKAQRSGASDDITAIMKKYGD